MGAVFGGFAMEGGHPLPFAADRIVNDRWGGLRIVLCEIIARRSKHPEIVAGLLKGSKYTKSLYMELMTLQFEVLSKCERRD